MILKVHVHPVFPPDCRAMTRRGTPPPRRLNDKASRNEQSGTDHDAQRFDIRDFLKRDSIRNFSKV